MSRWPFSVLGVEPDAEPREIKRAYARLLKAAHPEDDPAGFQALREAYEAATSGYWIPRFEPEAGPVASAEIEQPVAPDEAPAQARASTLVPASASAEEELWELQHDLVAVLSDPATTNDDRRAALAAVLASPALENVGRLTETEAWVGGLIAEYPGVTDALLDPAIERFGWDAQQRRWDLPWFVASALQRGDALTFLARLHDPKGPYLAGYRLLGKPPPRGVFFKGRKVEMVLRLLDEHPGLEPEFHPEFLAQWRDRLETMPFKPPASWKSAMGTLVFVLWIGLMVFKFLSPDIDERPFQSPTAYQAAQQVVENCHAAARAKALREEADTVCAAARMQEAGALTTQDALSLIAARKGQWRDAEAGWDTVLRSSPGDARALYGRGYARYQSKDPRGIADMEHALAIDPAAAAEFARLGLFAPAQVVTPPLGGIPGIVADERMGDVTMVSPEWASLPSEAQLSEVYPVRATSKGVEGRMSLNCALNAALRLDDCIVLYETPQGLGFADAALALSRHFEAKPRANGEAAPLNPRVQIPISFQMEADAV